MERIESILKGIGEWIARYRNGSDFRDDETILDNLENAAENLLLEIKYFRARKNGDEKIREVGRMARQALANGMSLEEQRAFDWAVDQKSQLTAARHAHVLAQYIRLNQSAAESKPAIEM
jgi:hypothetical protein